MKVKATIVNHQQGSAAWLAHRAKSLNASDLAAAMGLSKYKTRAQLIAEKATGIAPEVDAETQRRFDLGHQYEAAARPAAEEEIGEALYPCVLAADVEGLPLSASLDGMDLMQETNWEHKTGSSNLLASLESGVIPDEYHPQMEQGLMLSGASRCLFTASKGEREGMRSVWYESRPDLRAQIIPTWKQFMADVAAYQSPEAAVAVVAQAVQALPTVAVTVSGEIAIRENFGAFEVALRDFLENRLIREPKTDQDFADLDVQIKAMKSAEAALDSAEAQMLAQIQTVDTAKRTKDMLAKLVRDNRLMAEKLLASEKERRKAEIVNGGQAALRQHISALQARVGVAISIPADFAGVIKGKKSLASMEDAIGTELARAKIEASRIADLIDLNNGQMVKAEAGHLFPDFAQVCTKAAEDFGNLIVSRQAAAQQRIEAERERIRAEEVARLEREAAAKAEAERRAAEMQAQREANAAAAAAEQQRQAEASAKAALEAAAAPPPAPVITPQSVIAPAAPASAITPQSAEPATLPLGKVCERLGLTVTADFLESLGYPAHRERAAKLYRESDFPGICEAISAHVLKQRAHFANAGLALAAA